MDQFEFSFENDTLIRHEITNTDKPNEFHVKKVPVINKEAFQKCIEKWLPEVMRNGNDS